MFDPSSRYANIPDNTLTLPDGRTVLYKQRRLLPRGDKLKVYRSITLSEGERLDTIAAKTLGNPELFWRICDANNAMNPFQLTTSKSSQVLKIPGIQS